MTDFLHSFVKAIILERVKEKRIKHGEEALKHLPKRIPVIHRPLIPVMPIPPPRILPREIPVPRPSNIQLPKKQMIPIPISEPQQSPPTSSTPAPQIHEGYTKIILPDTDEVPIPGQELSDVPQKIPAAPKVKIKPLAPLPKTSPESSFKIRRPIQVKPSVKAMKVITPPKRIPPIKKNPVSVSKKLPIDFGGITDLVNDPYIKTIEYDAGKLRVTTTKGVEKDQGSFDEAAAKKIITDFAAAAKIKPQQTFEAQLGKFKLSAVMSEVLGVRFSIEKM